MFILSLMPFRLQMLCAPCFILSACFLYSAALCLAAFAVHHAPYTQVHPVPFYTAVLWLHSHPLSRFLLQQTPLHVTVQLCTLCLQVSLQQL